MPKVNLSEIWSLLSLLQHGHSQMGHVPRVCRCGLVESEAAWALGGRACPRCKRVWPETLTVLVLDPRAER